MLSFLGVAIWKYIWNIRPSVHRHFRETIHQGLFTTMDNFFQPYENVGITGSCKVPLTNPLRFSSPDWRSVT